MKTNYIHKKLSCYHWITIKGLSVSCVFNKCSCSYLFQDQNKIVSVIFLVVIAVGKLIYDESRQVLNVS